MNSVLGSLRHEQTALVVIGTGGGKTEIMIELSRRTTVHVVVLIGRDKLVAQTARRMRAVLDDVGVWSAGQGEKRVARVTVVSIHSADSLTIPGLKFIICDEAHNLNDGRYARFIERHPGVKIAGFTATPWRDGVEIYGEGKLFSHICYKRGILPLIKDGFLVPAVSKAPPHAFDTKGMETRGMEFTMKAITKVVMDVAKITEQVNDAMTRLTSRKKIVWMCATIEHAEAVARIIPENVSLVHSKNIHNDYAMQCFELGDIRHIVCVMMLSEGYDYPPIDAIVLMRPVRSPTLYVQTVGRGLRIAPGKTECLVLDYGEVIKNCGPLHDPHTKKAREKAKKEKVVLERVLVCSECLSYIHVGTICPDCQHDMKPVEADPVKSLTRTASVNNIMAVREPTVYQCIGVTGQRYVSKKGNECIKLNFKVAGKLWPISMYISKHPFSWRQGKTVIETLTPFTFNTWQECFDAVETLVFLVPESVETKFENSFEKITRIKGRARDPNIPLEAENRILLEEHKQWLF